MPIVNVHAAKTNLSQLLKQAQAGEEVIIAQAGVPVARLVPIASASASREPGGLDDLEFDDAALFATLPESDLQWWEGVAEDRP
jgi:prevent-host-death family protein